jgi:hypothetical protein
LAITIVSPGLAAVKVDVKVDNEFTVVFVAKALVINNVDIKKMINRHIFL